MTTQQGNNEKPTTTNNLSEQQEKSSFWDKKLGRFTRKAWALAALLFSGLVIIFTIIGMWDRIGQFFSDRNKATQESRKFRVLVPLQATTKEYLDYIQSTEPYDEKKLSFSSKVSRNIRDTVNATFNAWMSDGEVGGEKILNREKIDFYFFPEGYDEKTYSRAFEKALVDAEVEKREIVSIIGNVSSTSTLAYSKLCGKDKIELSKENQTRVEKTELDAKIPMILPLATATSLMHSLRVEGVPAFLRFPPANDKQAQFIANVLLKSAKPSALSTIVVKDLSNEEYSKDLVDTFRNAYVQIPLQSVEEDRLKYPETALPDNFGRILATVSIGGQNSNPFIYPSLISLKPDALVIFGMTDGSLETLAQAKASGFKFRFILLTDGAVDEYLTSRIATLVDKEQLKNIYLTFPLPCPMPSEIDTILDKKTADSEITAANKNYKRDFELTHALYVSDSVYMLLYLLEQELKKKDNPSSDIAKDIITKNINQWKKNAKDGEKTLEIKFPNSERIYKINQLGSTTNIEYHLFRLEIRKNPAGQDIPYWKHAESCPHSPTQDWKVKCPQVQ